MNRPLNFPDLIAIQALMHLMLQAAQADDWTELLRIDQQRKALLEKDSSISSGINSASATNDEAYASLVQDIQKLDHKIISTVTTARDGLADQNKVLRNQVKAKSIYHRAKVMASTSQL